MSTVVKYFGRIKYLNSGLPSMHTIVEVDLFHKGNYQNRCSVCEEIFSNTDKLWFLCPEHSLFKVPVIERHTSLASLHIGKNANFDLVDGYKDGYGYHYVWPENALPSDISQDSKYLQFIEENKCKVAVLRSICIGEKEYIDVDNGQINIV